VLVLGRIITNTSYADMYELSYTVFFQLVGERARKPVKWRHIHGEGFYGTTIDMCSKQMSGKSTAGTRLKHVLITIQALVGTSRLLTLNTVIGDGSSPAVYASVWSTSSAQ
jgi:hypothetical protein